MAASVLAVSRAARAAGRLVAIGAAALLSLAGAASAQTIAASRVSALTATVYARCDAASPVRQVLQRGAAVTIESVNEGWVNVRVDAGGEKGCMRRADLEPSAAIDREAQAQRQRRVDAARRGAASGRGTPSGPGGDRVIVSVNASYLATSRTFDDERTFPLHAETATFSTDYSVEPSIGVDAGGFVNVWRGLAAGVAFTSHSDARDITIQGSLPHPLLFNRNRGIEGTAAGEHEETAAHLQFGYIVPVGKSDALRVIVFGGPSFYTVKQSVVTAIQHTESYPFDEAAFSSATVETEEASVTGFNIGADVSYFFTPNVGVGGIVRFTGATASFSLGDVDAGGALVGGGLRLRF
jgi:hypothetical protein